MHPSDHRRSLRDERRRPRDANGWKIPAEGTIARRVYDVAIGGKRRREIVAALPDLPPRRVDACLCEIRSPDKRKPDNGVRPWQRQPWRERVIALARRLSEPSVIQEIDDALRELAQEHRALLSLRDAAKYYAELAEMRDRREREQQSAARAGQ